MKINFKSIVLFSALSMVAVSCQKTDDFTPLASSEHALETFQVMYSINGEVFQTTMSESEWDAFVESMLALAREGYEVSFSKNCTSLTSQCKEKVVFVTNNENEATAWAIDMANQGYYVTITYDKTTGEYTCVAIK